jgi:hypothetical protein
MLNELFCSITGMMRALGRVIRARQEERIIRTSVQEIKFNILHDVRYAAVRVATDQACQRSAIAGKFLIFYTNFN